MNRSNVVTINAAEFLDNPTLEHLSFALRHRTLWPSGYHWNFGFPNTCAMGLAHATWPHAVPVVTDDGGDMILAHVFKTDVRMAHRIFYGEPIYNFLGYRVATRYGDRRFKKVMPEDVAKVIDDCRRSMRRLAG
jgi:hypothetical protein